MMTMMGIIALAGVVVNNGVVLLDYTQLLIDRRKAELGLTKDEFISNSDLIDAIVKGGKARLKTGTFNCHHYHFGINSIGYRVEH